MSEEKRKVSTDALETLGTIITDGGRDAIHLAVEPVIAGERLRPGDDIGLRDGKAYLHASKHLGIVEEGEKFWLIVYPRQITSLRHVWSHPDFEEQKTKPELSHDPIEISKRWIESFANDIDQTYSRLMTAADSWVDYEEYTYDNSEQYKSHWEKFPEFWEHYKVVTGKEPKDSGDIHFFTCSC